MTLADYEYAPAANADLSSSTAPGSAPARRSVARMQLQAVRERGRLIDFVWLAVSPAAVQMLDCAAQILVGKGLLEVQAGPLGHPALIDRYRRVLEHGNPQSFAQVHLVDGLQDIVVHRVARSGDGVTVTLTNLSADRRVQVRRLAANARRRREQRKTQ